MSLTGMCLGGPAAGQQVNVLYGDKLSVPIDGNYGTFTYRLERFKCVPSETTGDSSSVFNFWVPINWTTEQAMEELVKNYNPHI